jgi:hypothetical protein
VRLTCSLNLVRHTRGAASSLTCCLCLAKLISFQPDHTAACSDRLLVHESTGSTSVYYGIVFSYRLDSCNSAFPAEIHVLCRALLFICQSRQYNLVCPDSLDALHSLFVWSLTIPSRMRSDSRVPPSEVGEVCCVLLGRLCLTQVDR